MKLVRCPRVSRFKMNRKVVQYCASLGKACGIAAYTEMLCDAQGFGRVKCLEELGNDIPAYLHVQHEFGIMQDSELKKVIKFCRSNNILLYVTMHTVIPIRTPTFSGILYVLLFLDTLYTLSWHLKRYIIMKINSNIRRKNEGTIGAVRGRAKPQQASENKFRKILEITLNAFHRIETKFGLDKMWLVEPIISQQLIIKNVDRILVHSEISKRVLLNFGADPEQIEVFHHPVKLCQTSNELYSAHDEKIHVGCFGFLREQKCILEIIEACDQIPNAVLHIYASTANQWRSVTYEKKVRERIAGKKWIKLTTAHLPLDEIVFNLSKCDVNVWYGGLYPYSISVSGSIRQYLAAKRPVIASDIPMIDDVRYIVHLVPPCNPRLLANAIRTCKYEAETLENYLNNHTWEKARIEYIANPRR